MEARDWLGRSTLDLVGLVEALKGRAVGLKVLTGEGASIDTTRPEGKLIFAVFGAFVEFERELIQEQNRRLPTPRRNEAGSAKRDEARLGCRTRARLPGQACRHGAADVFQVRT